MKALKGYRTTIIMLLTAAIGAIQYAQPLMSQEKAGVALLAVGILGLILRFVTDGPVGFSRRGE